MKLFSPKLKLPRNTLALGGSPISVVYNGPLLTFGTAPVLLSQISKFLLNMDEQSNAQGNISPENGAPKALTTAERVAALKQKLKKARTENLKAVDDEGSRQVVRVSSFLGDKEGVSSDDDVDGSRTLHGGVRDSYCKRPRKRIRRHGAAVDVGSADEADGEDEDDRLRSMKRRARNMSQQSSDIVPAVHSKAEDTVVTYGVTGHDAKPENVDRMVGELRHVEKRREKFRRRRAFHEDRSDISFINEGNRLFNRTLDKHFDKFESVKKLKDSLERGTA